jgi:hypothetical protein
MLKKCDSCNGQKKITGLGMLMHDCKPCSGIGWIDELPVTETPVVLEVKIAKSAAPIKRAKTSRSKK